MLYDEMTVRLLINASILRFYGKKSSSVFIVKGLEENIQENKDLRIRVSDADHMYKILRSVSGLLEDLKNSLMVDSYTVDISGCNSKLSGELNIFYENPVLKEQVVVTTLYIQTGNILNIKRSRYGVNVVVEEEVGTCKF